MLSRLVPGQYYHAKQSCYLCGQTSNLVDTEVQIEGEGVLGICKGCVHDMAVVAGWEPDAARELARAIENEADLINQLGKLKDTVKALRARIRDLSTR
jgi:hypothetical protein